MRVARMLLSVLAIAICAVLGSTQATAQSWQVMSADYGVSNNRMDVTNTVRRLVNGPDFRVNNTTMGGRSSPWRRTRSCASMPATEAGKCRTSSTRRDKPSTPGSLREAVIRVISRAMGIRNLNIVQASYGAGDRRKDVTSRLQSMVRNNRLSVLVNNSTMGGDPAFNQPKNLQVTYEYQGQRRNVNMGEGGRLTLP